MKLSISIPDEVARTLELRFPNDGWSARIQKSIPAMTLDEEITLVEQHLETLKSQRNI